MGFLLIALLAVVTLAFVLVSLTPGDPARLIAGPAANNDQLRSIRAELGLDRPLLERYVDYLGGLVRGDLGTSYFSQQPVLEELRDRLPATLELVAISVLLAAFLGVGVGAAGAYFRGRLPDRLGRLGTSIFQSIPEFLLGLLLIYVLFFVLGIAPPPSGQVGIADLRPERVTGFVPIDALLAGQVSTFWSSLQHLLLPVLTLGLAYAAYFAKTARSTIGKGFNSQQVQFARAMGLPERVVLRYAFLEARGTILTYAGVIFASLLGGAAIVETIFSWNGIGAWALEAMLRLDIPVVQGFVVVAGGLTLTVYAALDLLVKLLDPRISDA